MKVIQANIKMGIIKLLMVLLIVFILSLQRLGAAANLQQNYYTTELSEPEFQHLMRQFSAAKSYNFTDTTNKYFAIYYDTPELKLNKEYRYLRYQAREYFSRKQKRKYEENITYLSKNQQQRIISVKHYNRVKSLEGKHPLLSLIKRNERSTFIDVLDNDGIPYPMRLKQIFQVAKIVNTYELLKHDEKVATINLAQLRVSAFNQDTEFSILTLIMSEATSGTALQNELVAALGLENALSYPTEYTAVYTKMQQTVKFFPWIFQYPYLVNLLYALGLGLLGGFIIWSLFRKRLKNS